ncbi:uncharacterized protein LOC142509121 [Primulina tabacum]|uniref:uncharacterized protein LOC142509121 n=1 Tax=Primulina tabacum TaxID=48773 RepID=UPI003F59691D
MNARKLSIILDQNKLSGHNYNDWYQNLKIVLNSEKIVYVLNKKPPKEAATYRRFEEAVNAADINLHLKELYAIQTRSKRHAIVKELMTTRLRDGASVHEHGVRMIGIIEKLVGLDVVIPSELSTNIILISLSASFDGFVVNFNMNKLEATLGELINMLTNYEATIKKEKPVRLVGSSSSTKKGAPNEGKKHSAPLKKNKPNKKPYKKPTTGPTKPDKSEQFCFHYKKPGHWRRDGKKQEA